MTQAQQVVGVVTVTYNSASVLEDFMRSVEQQTGVTVRLYVVDNASADETLEILDAWNPPCFVQVIRNDDNLGVAEANNQGIRQSLTDGCDWVMLLNNDTIFAPDTLATLTSEAIAKRLDIVSPVIEATIPPHTIWYSGGAIHPWLGMKNDHLALGEPIANFPKELTSTEYAPTCALLFRPVVFERVGLMDITYFVYHDDVDFAIRARRAGFAIWVTPLATLTHKASSLTGGEFSDFSVRWSSRNWVLIARLHSTPLQLAFFAVFLQSWALARVIVRRDTMHVYRGRVRAYAEGWRLPLRDHKVEHLEPAITK